MDKEVLEWLSKDPSDNLLYFFLLQCVGEGDQFPFRKDLTQDRFAYIVALTYGRARINVTRNTDPLGVTDFW